MPITFDGCLMRLLWECTVLLGLVICFDLVNVSVPRFGEFDLYAFFIEQVRVNWRT